MKSGIPLPARWTLSESFNNIPLGTVNRTIRVEPHTLRVPSSLRHHPELLQESLLHYDPETAARCNDVLLAEVTEQLPLVSPREEGLERITAEGDRLQFRFEAPTPGLIVIPLGNRYAPRAVTGGLTNPITGKENGEVRGGTTISNLTSFTVAGFVNFNVTGRPVASLRVLGVLLDREGQPMNLASNVRREAVSEPGHCVGVLVCGSSMESGKTTFCIALAKALRQHGVRVTYEKKTGTACFCDPLRVHAGSLASYGDLGQKMTVQSDGLPVADFLDATGAVSDVSLAPELFVERSLSFTLEFIVKHRSQVHVVEFADNFSHRSTLSLLANRQLRTFFRHLFYVPEPSFDAAHHFLHFLRDRMEWRDVSVGLVGPLANDRSFECLRAEVGERLAVPVLPSRSLSESETIERLVQAVAQSG